MSRRAPRPPSALTPEQRERFDSEPGLAEEAARAALQILGRACFRHLEWEEMMAIAAIGVMEATVSFDPACGSSYRTWAFFKGVHRVLDAAREEAEQHGKTRALVRATVLTYFAQASTSIDLGFETEASLTDKLHDFTDPVLALAMLEVAASRSSAGGEDEIAEREAAERAGDALREVLAELPPDDRRMIDLHFVERIPLTQVAAVMGGDKVSYWVFVRRFHEVMAALRRGLERRGIAEAPPWMEGISGNALGPAG